MFVLFGTSHLAALGIALGTGSALGALSRLLTLSWLARIVRWALASTIIVTWLLWFWLVYESGWMSMATVLPMHLCDWTAIAVLITLIRRKQSSYELAYYWTFGGTLQALLTPDLSADFPNWPFLVFFGLHGAVIASVLFLTLGLRMRPGPSSILRILLWSIFYLSAAFTVNRLFGTNFGYLMYKPQRPNLLNVFGPWPYYVFEMALLGLVLAFVLYAPFFVWDRWTARRSRLRELLLSSPRY